MVLAESVDVDAPLTGCHIFRKQLRGVAAAV